MLLDESTTITGTVISNNTAGPGPAPTNVIAYGGGINGDYGLGNITNVTLSGNSAIGTGTGAAAGGGLNTTDGAVVLTNVNATNNTASTSGSGNAYGGGLSTYNTSSASRPPAVAVPEEVRAMLPLIEPPSMVVGLLV